MKDSISLGPVPIDEDCAQLGDPGYHDRASKECRAFINQLIRVFGMPPDGTQLKISRNPHDFGVYLDVEVEFNDRVEAAVEWAFNVEANLPAEWDEAAKQELK